MKIESEGLNDGIELVNETIFGLKPEKEKDFTLEPESLKGEEKLVVFHSDTLEYLRFQYIDEINAHRNLYGKKILLNYAKDIKGNRWAVTFNKTNLKCIAYLYNRN